MRTLCAVLVPPFKRDLEKFQQRTVENLVFINEGLGGKGGSNIWVVRKERGPGENQGGGTSPYFTNKGKRGSLPQNSFLTVKVTRNETDPFRPALSPKNKFMAAVPLKICKNEIIFHVLMI